MIFIILVIRHLCIVAALIMFFPSTVWGRSFHAGFLPLGPPSINTDGRRVKLLSNDRIVSYCPRRRHHHRKIAYNMNNLPNYFAQTFYSKKQENERESDASDDEDKDEEPKRGIFRRIRDRVSSTFGSSKVTGDTEGNLDEGVDSSGYKPNPLDGLRLRLAMAMAGLSNMNILKRKDEWVVACTKTRVGPGQIVPCVVNGLDIIIFASRDGKRLDAFANSCPHLGSPFDLATIERKPATEQNQRQDDGVGDGCVDCIVCPVHRTAFEIQSGEVRGDWCPYPPVIGAVMGFAKPKSKLVKFAVRLRGKNVEVRIATSVENVRNKEEQAEGMTDIK